MSQLARRREVASWVMIVDDDPLSARSMARLIMGTTNLRVAVVGDVEQALRLVSRTDEPPVAAVLDYDLRGGEKGLSVLLSLRSAGFEVPCAFHTGAADRARTALRKSRLGDGYPVFDKAQAGTDGLMAWLGARAPSREKDSPHRSGVREKLA